MVSVCVASFYQEIQVFVDGTQVYGSLFWGKNAKTLTTDARPVR
jgi:hypothetical protein